MKTDGKIYGIGVGIGDPEDITLKALRLIRESDILVLPREDISKCRAYQIVKKVMPEIADITTLPLEFEMVKDAGEREKNHIKIYETVKDLVMQGKTVSFLTIGDPAIFSTFSYIADLAREDGIDAYAVNGISSITAAANRLGVALCEKEDQLHVISEISDIQGSLDLPGTKVIMKCGRDIGVIKEILRKRGDSISVYGVSDCGTEKEKCYMTLEDLPDEGNYMMTLLIKSKLGDR